VGHFVGPIPARRKQFPATLDPIIAGYYKAEDESQSAALFPFTEQPGDLSGMDTPPYCVMRSRQFPLQDLGGESL